MAVSMAGKTVLVTGATQGIGLATAKALAAMGARVGLVGRDPKRTDEAAAQVKVAAPGAQVDTFLADLSLMSEVRKLAEQVKAKYPALHVLVNNAGAIFGKRKVTAEGLESTFALNHMSYFLLTNLLLELLKTSAPSRIVNVSSEAHHVRGLNLDDLQSEQGYNSLAVYGTSKLENILFTRELARRLQGTNVVTNSLHPGVIRSGFGKVDGGALGLFLKVFGVFLGTPEKGARTSVYLATSDEGGKVSGRYFKDSREKTPAKAAQDDAAAKSLWEQSAQLAGL